MVRFAWLLLITFSVVATSPYSRAQLVNVEFLGSPLAAPVGGVLSDVDLLSNSGEVLGVSGQDILLLGAPIVDEPVGGALSPLAGLGDPQSTVLEFLQETAGGNATPTVLTLELPGASDGSGSDFDNSKDRVSASSDNTLGGVSKDSAYRCLDKDQDSVCDSRDQCPNSPVGAMVLPSGCHLDVKAPLELRGVGFAAGTALLTASSTATLRQAARIIKANAKLKIEIIGHTDDLGDVKYNQRLSERRAEAVKSYFLAEGVPAAMLVARGYGEARPLINIDGLADQALVAARARNRRVELLVLKGSSQH